MLKIHCRCKFRNLLFLVKTVNSICIKLCFQFQARSIPRGIVYTCYHGTNYWFQWRTVWIHSLVNIICEFFIESNKGDMCSKAETEIKSTVFIVYFERKGLVRSHQVYRRLWWTPVLRCFSCTEQLESQRVFELERELVAWFRQFYIL